MHDLLRAVYQYPGLNDQEIQLILNRHKQIELKKGSFLLQVPEVSTSYYILYDGLMRSYVHDAAGNEITTNFFSNSDIVIEVASLFKQQATQENIQALSNCILFEISFQDFQEIFVTIPAFAEWGRMWMTMALSQQKERMLNMITQSAPQRYLQLLNEKPQVVQQAPLKYIASYLGITDTSLSRVRKEITNHPIITDN